MLLSKNATVAVADGEKLNLFRNAGDEATVKLIAVPFDGIDGDHGTTSVRSTSSANPDHGQAKEDQFSAGIVEHLNQQALGGTIEQLVVIAAPRALGEMRRHYHKALSAILVAEIPKDLTGHSIADLEKALASA